MLKNLEEPKAALAKKKEEDTQRKMQLPPAIPEQKDAKETKAEPEVYRI